MVARDGIEPPAPAFSGPLSPKSRAINGLARLNRAMERQNEQQFPAHFRRHESTGLSRSSVYLRVARGMFPHSGPLGGRAVGWPKGDVEAVSAAWIAVKSEAEICELVLGLEAERKAPRQGRGLGMTEL
jgi:prophage regulatory protein